MSINDSHLMLRERVPLATSFKPTLSIALSRARPMRNSSDKSALQSAQVPTSVCKCAHSIFSSGPQMSVAVVSCSSQPPAGLERRGQCLSRQRCLKMSNVEIDPSRAYLQLIAVEQRAGKCGFDMLHEVCLPRVLASYPWRCRTS